MGSWFFERTLGMSRAGAGMNGVREHAPGRGRHRSCALGLLAAAAGAGVLAAPVTPAGASGCLNEAFRTGRSAGLPDCRAYELVTPEDLGRTEDMTFENGADSALAGPGGDALALRALGVFLEPGANVSGARDVFSRAAHGWVMKPIATPAMLGEEVKLELFSPDLSQVAFSNTKSLSGTGGIFERGPRTFRLGPVGGPYTTIATVPEAYGIATRLPGANNGAPGVSALSDLVLESADHALLPAGPEREAAEKTEPGLPVLYEWFGGQLHLLNVDSEGRLLNPCGAVLGYKARSTDPVGIALNAVSADGSKVFFTSPQGAQEGPGCPEPALYMRVDGRQTVDVSEPEGVSVSPSGPVVYVGASADGSRVFFATGTALTPAAEATVGPYLYEYDTKAAVGHRLTLAGNQVPVKLNEVESLNPKYLVSEGGSEVYYQGVCSAEPDGQRVSSSGICRYEVPAGEAQTGKSTLVAVPREARTEEQPSFVTADGRFFLFQSEGTPQPVEFPGPHGLEQELRGGPNQQLYRYDASDGSVMCVSCGEDAGQAVGFQELPLNTLFGFGDLSRSVLAMSEDGSRVFFQTTAGLVPQDRNGSRAEEEKKELGPSTDVYEWEQGGSEEAPGVFCRGRFGCTHLISAGEAVGPERFLGASADGRDVFFESAAQLLPQATPEFGNIYDARVGGGFPPSRAVSAECSSCQGVGSPPPQFGQGASETFAGAGNPALAAGSVSSPARVKSKGKPRSRCGRGFVRGRRGRCVRVVRRRGVRR